MRAHVRWNWYTLALVAIVGSMWYAAEAQSNGAAHLIALLTASMGGLSWLHARANLRGLNIRLPSARAAAQDGSENIVMELRAAGALAPCGLEILVIGATKPVFVECVPAGRSVMVGLPPPVMQTSGPLRILVQSVYPLGLFTAEAVMQTNWERRVHPRPAGDLPLPSADSQFHIDASGVSNVGTHNKGGDDFSGLREWCAGDSPRHIDWRVVARGGAVMVKEWRHSAAGVVTLEWDTLMLEDNARAAQLARWMEVCEARELPYELRLPHEVIHAGLGTAHHHRCLDALAAQAEDGAAASNRGAEVESMDKSGSHVYFERLSRYPARPLLFLSLALLLTLWPLYGYIGNAGLVVCALCLLWRGVLRRRAPHFVVRVVVLAVGFAGVWFDYNQLRGMEPGIALLLVLAGGKMLESRTPREFQVLALLGWFLAFCPLLLENHLSRSIWALVVMLLITGCMVRFRRSTPGAREPLRVTSVLFAQAVPLAVVLFFVFPRGLFELGGAFGRGRTAVTGIDGTLDPGSLARVALRTEVAFRARFPDGVVPSNAERYWRCLTLWHCDGLRWRHGGGLGRADFSQPIRSPQDIRQIIDLEPHGQTWVPALDRPLSGSKRGARLVVEFDDTLVAAEPIISSQHLEVLSQLPAPMSRALPESHRRAALQLPGNIAPGIRQLIHDWQSAARSDEQIVQAAIQYLRTQGFSYTLEPGEYAGSEALEDFFLRRRTGFCEHFSASFATLMRMAGVPSRVVVGYLGGEYSDHNGGYLIVKQSDVHAWAEVWLERFGWFRVDPTAELAPDRVNFEPRWFFAGGAAEIERQRRSLWGRLSQRARLLWDSINYAWQSQIIDYNQEAQRGLLSFLGLRQNKLLLLLPSVAAVLLVGMGIAWWLRRPARYTDPWKRAWQRLCGKLAKAGVRARFDNEGPLTYAGYVSQACPELAAQIRVLAELYAAGRYGDAAGRLGEFQHLLSQFKPRKRMVRAAGFEPATPAV